MKKTFNISTIISIIIIVVQLCDILIHYWTNQFELVRVQSNIIIIMWVFYISIRRNSILQKIITTASISIYLILNFVFVFENGILNPNSNEIRFLLLILVGLTSVLFFFRVILNNTVLKEKNEKQ
jgi:hypothetical protein